MQDIALTFLLILSLPGVVIAVAKTVDQVMRDKSRKSYRLAFPSDLDPERVTAWVRSISGTLRPGPGRYFHGLPTIVLEIWSTNRGIVHRLKVPWQYEPYIRPKLETLVPGIRLVAEDEYPRRIWVHAVEAGLKNSTRQLRVYNPTDLSTSILANFGTLTEDETLMMQWVISPAMPEHKPIYKEASAEAFSIVGLFTGNMASRDEVEDRRAKLEEPNLLTVLRVGAVASTEVRAQYLVRGVMSSLDAARGPSTKFYKRLVGKDDLQRRIDRAAAPVFKFPVKLSAPEVTAVIGWPLNNPLISGLPATMARYLPTNESIPREGRIIGLSNFPGRERRIAVSYADALKHMHVMGPTGVGKTVLLANMMKQDMAAGHGVVLIENKGDLFNAAMNYIPPERLKDVIVMDVNDTAQPLGFNILRQGDPAVAIDELDLLFQHMYRDSPSIWMKEMMFHGLHTLALDKNATFIDLPALISPDADEIEWSDELRRRAADPQLRNFWQRFENQKRTRQDQIVQPVLSRVWPMARSKMVNIFGQSESSFQMTDVVRDHKILLVNLANIEPGVATLTGTLLMNALWQAVKTNPQRERPNWLYLDEFQDFMTMPVDTEDMLAKSRGFGLGMVLAHQHLSQLSGDMKDAIIANARTKVIFQTNANDARQMANNFGKSVADEDFLHLGRYEAIARIATNEGVSSPLTLATYKPARGFGTASDVRKASRDTYGRKLEDVQRQIIDRRKVHGDTPRRKPNIGTAGAWS